VPPTPAHMRSPKPHPILIKVTLRPGETATQRISRPSPFKAHAGSEVAIVFLNHDNETRTAWIEDDIYVKKGKKVSKERAALFVEHPKSAAIPPLGFATVRYKISPPDVLGLSQKTKKKTFKYTIAIGDQSGNLVDRLDPQGDVTMPPTM
jgi:hypothetical protein